MIYDPNKHHRRSIRLKNYDYSQPGAYFITICTHNRQCLFGEIVNGEMVLNEYGEIAKQCWLEIPVHFPHVQLDEFVIMPNHVHGIIIVGSRHALTLQIAVPPQQIEQFGKPTHGSIPTIIRSYKSACTKQINIIHQSPANPVWQRNYYEHIIRNENELDSIREYIINNPLKWSFDLENSEKQKDYKRHYQKISNIL